MTLIEWHYADEALREAVRDRYPGREIAAAMHRWRKALDHLAELGDEDAIEAVEADGRNDESHADALERLRRRAKALRGDVHEDQF